MDEAFDAHATLIVLKAGEEGVWLLATQAETHPQVKAKWAAFEVRFGNDISEEDIKALFDAMTDGRG